MEGSTVVNKISDDEINALIKDIEENPDKILDKTYLTDEQILRINKKLNPYSYTKKQESEEKKVAMISYTNVEEEYTKRFLMTSLVGFIYRMLEEVELSEEVRSYTEEGEKVDEELPKSITEPFTYNKLKGLYDTIGSVLPTLKKIEESDQKIKLRKSALDIEGRSLSSEDTAQLCENSKRKGALLYGLSYTLIEAGRDTERRLKETIALCEPYEDVMTEVRKRPIKLTPPPSLRIVPNDNAKDIIRDFLNSYFEYNPDEHVKSAHDEEKMMKVMNEKGIVRDDSSRPSLRLLQSRVHAKNEIVERILNCREDYNFYLYLLNRRYDSSFINTVKRVLEDMDNVWYDLLPIREEFSLADIIPPQDTFNRWDYYMEVYMEEIRKVVHCVYHEKPYYDLMFIIYDILEGDEKKLEKDKATFYTKYGQTVAGPVYGVEVGNWVIMSNFKENRKEVDMEGRHTEILKRILDRYEEDKKLGKDLMMKRVKKSKKKNIEEVGPDAEIMKEYQAQLHDLSALGAEKGLSEEELRELENIKNNMVQVEEVADVPDDAIQVNVFRHDTKTGKLSKNVIYTEAEVPKMPKDE